MSIKSEKKKHSFQNDHAKNEIRKGEKQHCGNGGREEWETVKSQFLALYLLALFHLSLLLASHLLLLILNTYKCIFGRLAGKHIIAAGGIHTAL